MMEFIFGMQVNIEVFYKVILSFLVCVARHAQTAENKKHVQNTQKNKLAYLCNTSRKT